MALVVGEHAVFRWGLSDILKEHCGYRAVAEEPSLDGALTSLGQIGGVTIAVFDMPAIGRKEVSIIQTIRQTYPKLKVAVICESDSRDDILTALAAGVHGYLLRSHTAAEVGAALKAVCSERVYVPWCLTSISSRTGAPALRRALQQQTRLTARQHDILKLIHEGKSNKEIASGLGLSENTIKVHITGLFKALGVASRAQALAYGTPSSPT